MRYHALACDYDSTLAHDGKVSDDTLALIEKFLATGRKLILVTGRELNDLQDAFPKLKLFHRVVVENGAVLYDPSTRQEKALTPPIPNSFVESLRNHGVTNFSVGRVIISTQRPAEHFILATIRDMGLELQTIFNRSSVMILPAGINKSTGLAAALDSLCLSPHEVVGVGDAENDHALLKLCEFSVAVENALPSLKESADWVTNSSDTAGVGELIEHIISDDLESLDANVTRHRLLLGTRSNGSQEWLSPRGPNVLIAGPSGSGKSSVATSILECLIDKHYQFCIIDPEGDYEGLPDSVTLGRGGRGPMVEEVMEVLLNPQHNIVVNLLGLPVTERPPFFLELLPKLQKMRAQTGRPHWMIVDEAHHLLPATWEPNQVAAVGELTRTVFITVHADQILPAALRSVGIVLAVGKEPQQTLELFAKFVNLSPPQLDAKELGSDKIVLWSLSQGNQAFPIRIVPSHIERQRHVRKYAIGELPPDRSFYFRGPDNKLNLRAQNLHIFLQLAEGIDTDTWMYHLRHGDYSRWFRKYIKDEQLADETEQIEQQTNLNASESLSKIREIIERTYMPIVPPPLPIPGTDAAPTSERAQT